MDLEGGRLEHRTNERGFHELRMVCLRHTTGEHECARTFPCHRSAAAPRHAGRPLGHLLAWLRMGAEAHGREHHMWGRKRERGEHESRFRLIPFEMRLAEREAFSALPMAAYFLARERHRDTNPRMPPEGKEPLGNP